MFDYLSAEKVIGYIFKDKKLLQRAFTLSSASADNNERLEFFGDSVLQMVVSESLFSSGKSEGDMTAVRQRIVSGEALNNVVNNLGLCNFLIRGKGDNNNKKAISSVFEAVVAALYIDGGYDAAKRFILSSVDMSGGKAQINYKGNLQELIQGKNLPAPVYECTDIGTQQAPEFSAKVCVFNKEYCANGKSKKEAEQLAAKLALEDNLNK